MIKNVIMVLLLVAIIGGGYIFVSSEQKQKITDRNGYGILSQEKYDCDRFSFTMDFSPEMVVFDGVSAKDYELSYMTEKEIEEASGLPIENVAFVFGTASSHADLSCLAYMNYNFSEEHFDEEAVKSTMDFLWTSVTSSGGSVKEADCSTFNVKGSGRKAIMYYYDYELSGERYNEFACSVNCGNDALLFRGYFSDAEGLRLLKSMVQNDLILNI